jgi:demethylspheroidene O-methyltransferase
MVELDLFHRLAHAPASTATLAAEVGLPPRSMEVLLTAAAALGLVDRRRAGWGLGLKGAAILGQGGIAEMVAHHRHFYADLADPVRLMKGDSPTALAAYWTYAGGPRERAEDAAAYTALMAASQSFIAGAVLHNRVFREARHLLDLGGGAGAFAVAALRRHPSLTVTIADRPDVVPHAERVIAASGLAGRARVVAVDFFVDPLPEADLVSLVRVLHDHDDDGVARVLDNVARHCPGVKLAVIEPMANPRRPSGLDAYFPWYFRAMGQGRYRTREELSALLSAAGYRKIRPLPSRNPTLAKGLLASSE